MVKFQRFINTKGSNFNLPQACQKAKEKRGALIRLLITGHVGESFLRENTLCSVLGSGFWPFVGIWVK
jgi:hypothetical protein